jgi:hypothetical protein
LAQTSDSRAKQAESEPTGYTSIGRSWHAATDVSPTQKRAAERFGPTVEQLEQSTSGSWGSVFVAVLGKLLFIISLPFRVVFWTIAWLGRMAVSSLGFVFMVLGVVLWAGPSWFFGILLFLAGLVLLLKSLR